MTGYVQRVETRRANAEKRQRTRPYDIPANAESYLRCWGHARSGAIALPDPLAAMKRLAGLTSGEARRTVVYLIVGAFVEETEGFQIARPALEHAYVKQLPPEEYRLCEPGETLLKACLRHGWGEHIDRPKDSICEAVRYQFWWELRCRLQEESVLKWESHLDAETSEEFQGPVSETEREQWFLLKGIRAAEARGDEAAAARLGERLEALRAFAVDRVPLPKGKRPWRRRVCVGR